MARVKNLFLEKQNASYATVKAFNIPLSMKFCVEIGNSIRHKNLLKAKLFIQNSIANKKPIPFKRFNRDLGHKPGMSSGRFPYKALSGILKLLESLEANAENKNLNINKLIITEFMANKGNTMWHYGRKRRRLMKRCHIFVKAEEIDTKNDRTSNTTEKN